MGLYTQVYLCTGVYRSPSDVDVSKFIPIDVTVDAAEWNAAKVDVEAIKSRAASWNIDLSQSSTLDLFLQESTDCTLEHPPSRSNRHVLIEHGLTFLLKDERVRMGAVGSAI